MLSVVADVTRSLTTTERCFVANGTQKYIWITVLSRAPAVWADRTRSGQMPNFPSRVLGEEAAASGDSRSLLTWPRARGVWRPGRSSDEPCGAATSAPSPDWQRGASNEISRHIEVVKSKPKRRRCPVVVWITSCTNSWSLVKKKKKLKKCRPVQRLRTAPGL